MEWIGIGKKHLTGHDGEKLMEKYLSSIEAMYNQANAVGNWFAGFSRYLKDFMVPYLTAVKYFSHVEMGKMATTSPLEGIQSHAGLLQFNGALAGRAFLSSMKAANEYVNMELKQGIEALSNTLLEADGDGRGGKGILAYTERLARMTEMLASGYPRAIEDIASEYGFGFERGENVKVAETERFILYQILPVDPQTDVRAGGKPILILPPYVLGANILGFLPRENRSYAHCFANLGIPTYIRIMKDIAATPAVQLVTGEDDAEDTRRFCERSWPGTASR
jgi:hypothetical protein